MFSEETYTLGVAVADWDFCPWNVLHTTGLSLINSARAHVIMTRLWKIRDIERNDCVHLRHLAASLHVRDFDQLGLAVDVELENFLFGRGRLRRWLHHAEAHRSRVLHGAARLACHLGGRLAACFLLLLLDDQVSHAHLTETSERWLLNLDENVCDALLDDLLFVRRVVFVEHERDVGHLSKLFQLRDRV